MLLFALVGATKMSAQEQLYILTPGERVTEITAGQQYMIYNSCESNGGGYCFFLYNNGSAFAGVKSTNPSTFSITGTEAVVNKYIFTAETGSVDGTFAMKNVASNTYPQGTTTQSNSAVNLHFEEWTASSRVKATANSYNHDGTTTANASITTDNKVWVIYKDGENYSWSNTRNNNQPSTWESAQPFAIYTINKVPAVEINMTFTDTKTGNVFTLNDQIVEIGLSASSAVGRQFYTINSITDQNGNTIETIAETTTALNVSVTHNFPFEVMTFTDGAFANANFYTMLNDNTSRDIVYGTDQNIRAVSGIKDFNKESLWAFELVTGTEANFRIYNLAAGASKCISKDGTGTGTVTMGNPTSDSSIKEFVLYINRSGYGFHIPGTTTACLNPTDNLADEGNNTSLGVWNDNASPNDNGSRFFFTSVDDMTAAATEMVGIEDQEYPTTEGYISVYTGAQDAYYLYQYNNQKTFAKLNAALEGVSGSFDYKNPYGYDFNPSKVYQIISYNDANCQGWTIYSNTWCGPNGGNDQYDDRKILIGADRPIAETFVWFEAVDHGYRIHHANSDYRFVQLSAFEDMATPDMPVATNAGGVYVITPAKTIANVFALSNYNTENKWLHCGSGDGNTMVRAQAPAVNDGDLWLIKEVSKIPVTIGAAKWSTLCLPVAVTVPDDANLKVYTVSGVDNGTGVMTLNVVEPGTVVAKKTGLLLASTSENGGTYDFTVSTEAGTSYNNNILMGTTARRIGFNTNDSADPTAITTPPLRSGTKGRRGSLLSQHPQHLAGQQGLYQKG